MDAKRLRPSLFPSVVDESGPVIFGLQTKQTRANTHTQTSGFIRSKLTGASAMQTMTVPVQNTQNESQAISFQWAQLCCLGLTEGKNAEAAKKHWNVHSKLLPYEKAKQTTILKVQLK